MSDYKKEYHLQHDLENKNLSDDEEDSSSTDEKVRIKTKTIIYEHIIGRRNYGFFQKELKKFKTILLNFVNRHTIYLMITNVKNDENRRIIKAGYTYDILDRIAQIYQETKNQCFPIEIDAMKTEKNITWTTKNNV